MSDQQAPSYQAVLLGQISDFSDLSALYPAEEAAPEGALILLNLHLSRPADPDEIAGLNRSFLAHGVPPWPDNTDIVFADPGGHDVCFEWVKGQAELLIGIALIAGGSILPSITTIGGLTAYIPVPGAAGWTTFWNITGEIMIAIGAVLLMLCLKGQLTPAKQVFAPGPVIVEKAPQARQKSTLSKAAKAAGQAALKKAASYVRKGAVA